MSLKCSICKKQLSRYSGECFTDAYEQYEGVVCKSCGKILCDDCHPSGKKTSCPVCGGELLQCITKNIDTYHSHGRMEDHPIDIVSHELDKSSSVSYIRMLFLGFKRSSFWLGISVLLLSFVPPILIKDPEEIKLFNKHFSIIYFLIIFWFVTLSSVGLSRALRAELGESKKGPTGREIGCISLLGILCGHLAVQYLMGGLTKGPYGKTMYTFSVGLLAFLATSIIVKVSPYVSAGTSRDEKDRTKPDEGPPITLDGLDILGATSNLGDIDSADLIQKLEEEDERRRMDAVEALLKSGQPENRIAAIQAAQHFNLTNIGVVYELVNCLGDENREVKDAAGLAIWRLDQAGLAIRSLKDEYLSPVNMSSSAAKYAVKVVLKKFAPDEVEWNKLYMENWDNY